MLTDEEASGKCVSCVYQLTIEEPERKGESGKKNQDWVNEVRVFLVAQNDCFHWVSEWVDVSEWMWGAVTSKAKERKGRSKEGAAAALSPPLSSSLPLACFLRQVLSPPLACWGEEKSIETTRERDEKSWRNNLRWLLFTFIVNKLNEKHTVYIYGLMREEIFSSSRISYPFLLVTSFSLQNFLFFRN